MDCMLITALNKKNQIQQEKNTLQQFEALANAKIHALGRIQIVATEFRYLTSCYSMGCFFVNVVVIVVQLIIMKAILLTFTA